MIKPKLGPAKNVDRKQREKSRTVKGLAQHRKSWRISKLVSNTGKEEPRDSKQLGRRDLVLKAGNSMRYYETDMIL